MIQSDQLEMTFDRMSFMFRPADRRQRRFGRARWWFEQMRQVVDRAFDWQPAPTGRPEQIWFQETRGSIYPGCDATSGTRMGGSAPSAAPGSLRAVCE